VLLYELIYWLRRPMSGKRESERQQACVLLLTLLSLMYVASL
jgi:hypothetical protein